MPKFADPHENHMVANTPDAPWNQPDAPKETAEERKERERIEARDKKVAVRGPSEVARQEPSLLEIIRELAVDARVDVAKLEGLMALQERAEAREAEREFNGDLAAAMGEMPRIVKDGKKGLGVDKSTGVARGDIPYATYEHLDASIRPIEKKYGFCRIFTSESLDKPGTRMTVRLIHRAGHSISSTRYLPPDPGPGRNDIQASGSSDSYARRYLTLAIWNLITVGADDDGRAAGFISEEQAMRLGDLLQACNFNADRKRRFLDWAEAPSVDQIQAARYEAVRKWLEGKTPGGAR